ncbi:methyltransferase domain-containing protein [Flavihumibacter sp. R14]|nr:methyltransferase domain-containing protein [Flavihumibacter soli]
MFENIYIATRRKERRVYSDDEVRVLPQISSKHEHYREWKIRSQSERRLVHYLKEKQKPLNILEVGCGNGWLSKHLSEIPLSHVTGVDVNQEELNQAERLFKAENLKFIPGDIRSGVLQDRLFDIIVLAASVQYFSSIQGILDACLLHLEPVGEIHVIDTHFYRKSEVSEARKRSEAYYKSIGSPEMAGHYFHHCLEDLSQYNYRIMKNPSVLQSIIGGVKSPFPWICLCHMKPEMISR